MTIDIGELQHNPDDQDPDGEQVSHISVHVSSDIRDDHQDHHSEVGVHVDQ
jgi:hypothetical protein